MKVFVSVKPNSGKQEVEKISESEFKVYLKSAAKEGKANMELLKVLQKYFGKEVKIKSGKSSRKKIVEVNH